MRILNFIKREIVHVTYEHRANDIIYGVNRRFSRQEKKDSQDRVVRRSRNFASNLREAFSTPNTDQNWLATTFIPPGVAETGNVLAHFVNSPFLPAVPFALAQIPRGLFSLQAYRAYKRDHPRDDIQQTQGFLSQAKEEDFAMSGELRLLLSLRYQEKKDPRLEEEGGGLGRVIKDPEMLSFVRGKLDSIYEALNARVHEHDLGEGDLGDSRFPILTTRAIRYRPDLKGDERRPEQKGVEQDYLNLFAGRDSVDEGSRKFGEGNPIHAEVIKNLKNDNNTDLRLDTLRGAATAISNTAYRLTSELKSIIRTNRISRNINVVQVVAGLAAAIKLPGGFTTIIPVAYALSGLTIFGLPVVSALMVLLLVGGTALSAFAGISRIRKKNEKIKIAKHEKKEVKGLSRPAIEQVKALYDLQHS